MTFRSTIPIAELPHCNIAFPNAEVTGYWDELKRNGLKCLDYNCHGQSTIKPDFDILRARFKGHWYYCLPFKSDRLLLVLVCHDALMKEPDIELFKVCLEKGFGHHKPRYLYAARFKSRDNLTCGDKLIMQACARLRSFPMLIIGDNDVKALVRGEGLDLIPEFGLSKPETRMSSDDEDDDEINVVDPEQEQLVLESQESFVQITNDGHVSSDEDQPKPIDDLREQIASVQDDDTAPSLCPRDDPFGQLLSDREFFLGYLGEFVSRVSDCSSMAIKLHEPTDFAGLSFIVQSTFEDNRFLFVPLFTYDVSMLVILDSHHRCVGCMNPSRVAAAETLKYVRDALVHFPDYSISRIELTLSFHQQFQLAYLMAGIITLRRHGRTQTIYQNDSFIKKSSSETCAV